MKVIARVQGRQIHGRLGRIVRCRILIDDGVAAAVRALDESDHLGARGFARLAPAARAFERRERGAPELHAGAVRFGDELLQTIDQLRAP